MVEFFDIEYEIEKRLIKGFRSIFEKDSRFRYNKKQEMSELLITVDYPDNLEVIGKQPHLIVSQVSYQNNIQNTFGYNFLRDVKHKGLNNGAQEYAHIIPFTASLICTGHKNISKDLASRVNWYASHAASGYLNEHLELQMSDVQKGPTSPSKQHPEKIFDTVISVRGTLYWIGTKGPEDPMAIDKPLKNVKINFLREV